MLGLGRVMCSVSTLCYHILKGMKVVWNSKSVSNLPNSARKRLIYEEAPIIFVAVIW